MCLECLLLGLAHCGPHGICFHCLLPLLLSLLLVSSNFTIFTTVFVRVTIVVPIVLVVVLASSVSFILVSTISLVYTSVLGI